MDIQSLWLRTQELWGMLDQHPWVRTGLALILLLTAALVLGRVARFVLLYTVRMLGRQPSLHWINDFRHNKVFHRLAQMVPSLVVQFGLNLVPGLTATGKNVIGNLAMAFTILFMTLAIGALLNALL
ncbi:mechanosensitive ion channel protein MscS, partial [Pseudomonas syringae pv. actinidifoliorum]|nr:mechanosensitive ion channel protein MscS [Pseudomonas syringae pv. actinidifoliorum]